MHFRYSLSIIDSTYEVLEKYVVLLYDKTCQLTQVNEARQHLFARRSRALENIPPTQAALTQHIIRTAYQAGHVWGAITTKVSHITKSCKLGLVPK